LFSRPFYEALVGRTFDDDIAAARHWIRHGSRLHLPPHPGIPFSSLPRWLRRAMRERPGQVFGPVVRWAHSATSPARQATTAELDAARTFGEQKATLRPRVFAQWDDAAEAGWIAEQRLAARAQRVRSRVSVVMPVRNRAAIVGEAIESVRRQTYGDWELLVVDDGSTDDTRERVAEYVAADPRIRLLTQHAQGVSAARNRALEEAAGDVVAFLDSDNQWRPHFLELTVGVLDRSGALAVHTAARLIGVQGEVSYRAFDGGLAELSEYNHIDLNVLVVRTEAARAAGGFDTALKRWVDHDFALALAKRYGPPILLPFVGCDYADSREGTDRITTSESNDWQYAVLGKHRIDWDALGKSHAGRRPDAVSVVLAVLGEPVDLPELIATAPPVASEIVVVMSGTPLEDWLSVARLVQDDPRLRPIRLARPLPAGLALNQGVAATTGGRLHFPQVAAVAGVPCAPVSLADWSEAGGFPHAGGFAECAVALAAMGGNSA
jgi:hypothetical protein